MVFPPCFSAFEYFFGSKPSAEWRETVVPFFFLFCEACWIVSAAQRGVCSGARTWWVARALDKGPWCSVPPRRRNAGVCGGDGWAHCPNRSLLANWEHIAVSVRHSITAWIAPLVLRLSECEREREIFLSARCSVKKPLVTVWEHCLNAGVQEGKEVKKKGWGFYHLLLYF